MKLVTCHLNAESNSEQDEKDIEKGKEGKEEVKKK